MEGRCSTRQETARHLLKAILLLSGVLSGLLCGCNTAKLPNYPPAYREYAYIADGKSNEVSVIDLLTFKNVKRIPVGEGPTGVVASRTTNEIYVVNSESNNLSIIDAERNAVVATIGLHRSPYFVDLTPDGKRAYIANSGSANVSVVDLKNRRVIGIISVGHAPGLVRVSPDGKTAIASNRADGTVSIIDTESMKVRSTISVCTTPEEIVFLLDSTKAFVSCSSVNEVAVVQLRREPPPSNPLPSASANPSLADAKHKTEKKPQRPAPIEEPPAESLDRLLAQLDVGNTPVHLALKPDGGEIFVSNFGSDSVSEVLTGTNEVSSTHLLGPGPVRSVVNADNSLLYVSNFKGNCVSIYSIDDGKLLQTISVGGKPDGLAFTPDQHYLLVIDSGSGDVSVIRHDSSLSMGHAHILFTMVPVGLEPRQIAVKAFMMPKPE